MPTGFAVAYSGYAPLVRGLAARLADHQAVPGNRVLVIYCYPLLGDVFDKHPAFERFYAGRHALRQGALANYGATENSFVIWKGKSDSLSVPHPGANAVIRTRAMHAEIEA